MSGSFRKFWSASFLDQLHYLSNLYYRVKGIVFYRLLFKEFGAGSYIRRPILISNPGFASIGKRVSVRDGVRLEVIRLGNRRIPQLIIENGTNIEQNVHIVCHSRVHIGNNVSITANCAIVDVTHPFVDVHNPQSIGLRIEDEDSFVEIGDGSFVGFGAVILPNVRIGRCAVIGANSVVIHDVPDYSVAAGAPAVVLEQYDFKKSAWVKISSKVASPIS
jgi:acetyltransferase-like isoleucine patch superfamily enzyme